MNGTPRLVVELLRLLEELSITYMVGGSFASSAWGRPRQTLDLDLAVTMQRADADRLFAAVRGNYVVSQQEMLDAISSDEAFRGFQIIHMEEVFKIDFFVVPNDEYSFEAFARSRRYPIAADFLPPFASPEDIVLTKLRWFDLGNRVSDRQWNDIIHLLEIQAENLDQEYLHRWAVYFNVLELFQLATAEAS